MNYVGFGKQFAKSFSPEHGNSNASSISNGRIQPNIFDTLIPGWSLISHLLSETFGFDVSAIVTVVALVFGFFKASTWLWTNVVSSFEGYCMAKVHIDNDDLLFDTVLKWLGSQKVAKTASSVRAKTKTGSAFEEDEGEREAGNAVLDESGHYNYGKLQARVAPQYEPHYGNNHFWHKGTYFRFNRKLKSQQSIFSDGNEDELILYCVGWSTAPIKSLLQDIKAWTIREQVSKTSIRHATSRMGRGGSNMTWSARNPRPSRPISTVILDEKQKAMVINDMNEFLDPRTPAWYATRGIPYRRGYLFHGPPGTGKTSLSFALAGIFGLDLYCISLNDPDMTESDLRDLFNQLPRRCIVLLEDIDEAGIKRPDHKSGKETGPAKLINGTSDAQKTEVEPSADGVKPVENGVSPVTPATPAPAETQWTLQDLARAIMNVSQESSSTSDNTSTNSTRARPRRGKNPLDNKKSDKDAGISLSGLLNAIDGVATHEGRVLIMTTNHPEALDEALVRAGRVDLRIAFDYASRPQAKALFLRMYAPHEGREMDTPVEKLDALAEAFATGVPDRVFSPSEVQGYLLMHKKTPAAAVEGMGTWVAEERKRKLEKSAAKA